MTFTSSQRLPRNTQGVAVNESHQVPPPLWRIPDSPWGGFVWIEVGRSSGPQETAILTLYNGARHLYIAEAECQRVPE